MGDSIETGFTPYIVPGQAIQNDHLASVVSEAQRPLSESLDVILHGSYSQAEKEMLQRRMESASALAGRLMAVQYLRSMAAEIPGVAILDLGEKPPPGSNFIPFNRSGVPAPNEHASEGERSFGSGNTAAQIIGVLLTHRALPQVQISQKAGVSRPTVAGFARRAKRFNIITSVTGRNVDHPTGLAATDKLHRLVAYHPDWQDEAEIQTLAHYLGVGRAEMPGHITRLVIDGIVASM